MTETTRQPQSTPVVPAALYLALELGSTKWTLAFGTSPGERARIRPVAAGDGAAVLREIARALARWHLPPATPVRSCYEAGRDGFWVHRWLTQHGVTNVVVDAASIEVNRRARRAKTDRLDVGKLLALLLRHHTGERVWSVVHVPTVADESARQLSRELATVRQDATRVRNRMQGLLATQGVVLAFTGDVATRLAQAHTGDGQPLPLAYVQRLQREWAHLQTIEARRAALEAERDAVVATGTDRVARVARQLTAVRSVGPAIATTFSAELLGTRTFRNGRELAAVAGLVPVPYRSDQQVHDQGISKAGRGELRRLAVQLAWGWLRWQPDSALAQWFRQRFGAAGRRSRRIGIVAAARKLLIALWRWVTTGTVMPGATLKPVRGAGA